MGFMAMLGVLSLIGIVINGRDRLDRLHRIERSAGSGATSRRGRRRPRANAADYPYEPNHDRRPPAAFVIRRRVVGPHDQRHDFRSDLLDGPDPGRRAHTLRPLRRKTGHEGRLTDRCR